MSATDRRLEQILGYGISDTAGARTYQVVDGVIYADLFDTAPTSIPGFPGAFHVAFNGKRNGMSYWNEIILDAPTCLASVTLDLDWGSDDFNTEIQPLLDWLIANPGASMLDAAAVKSKHIEDFSVTMASGEELVDNQDAILAADWSFYIRSPLIIGVSREHRNDWRHF